MDWTNSPVEAEIVGLLRAIESGDRPASLRQILFAELNEGRAKRLTQHLIDIGQTDNRPNASVVLTDDPLGTRQRYAPDRPTVFVAMPFSKDFEDIYNFGIQSALHKAGMKCERIDQLIFVGDVIAEMKRRIARARFVVADVSGANPNVYLEIGFAWASGVPVVLVARRVDDMKQALRFDTQGQKCLIYQNITELEQTLREEVVALLRDNLV